MVPCSNGRSFVRDIHVRSWQRSQRVRCIRVRIVADPAHTTNEEISRIVHVERCSWLDGPEQLVCVAIVAIADVCVAPRRPSRRRQERA